MAKIYESPDGGLTVYERDTKTGKRKCIEKPKYPDYYILDHEWYEITEMAENGNKALQKLLKEVKIIYALSKEHEPNWWE